VNIFRNRLLLSGLATGLLALPTAQAVAEETSCSGTLRSVTVDNLVVPQGASCKLYGTRVKGTIKVEYGAQLRAEGVIVIGNVQAEGARSVSVTDNSRVGGSVQVKQGGSALVSDSKVEGDVQYDENTAALRVLRSDIGGGVQIVKNFGGVTVRRNVIDGNLQCKENSPAPVGGGNIVGGTKEDQCARL
jgi:hypothetical protein